MKRHERYLHPNQIPTTRKVLLYELRDKGHRAMMSLFRCFTCERGSEEYKRRVFVTAMYLERISCPVYLGQDGDYRKLTAEKYKQHIFEGHAELPEEVTDMLPKLGYPVSADEAARIHKMIWLIADIVCPMIACTHEQGFISEYAYAIDYVISHDGDIERPVMDGGLFPRNYSDYRYQEGIAAEVMRYEVEFRD